MQTVEIPEELSAEQSAAILDSAARYFLNMSGEEFLTRWQAGQFQDPDSIPGVMEVASLLAE